MAGTSKYLCWSAVAFVFFWAMQWVFGVREPGANEAAQWIIGTGKVLTMLATVGLAGRLLYLKRAGHKTESGSSNG